MSYVNNSNYYVTTFSGLWIVDYCRSCLVDVRPAVDGQFYHCLRRYLINESLFSFTVKPVSDFMFMDRIEPVTIFC